MRVIGLDLGMRTGYAYTDGREVVGAFSGEWNLESRRHEGGGMRFLRFRSLLLQLVYDAKGIAEPAPDVAIFFEEATIASRSPNQSSLQREIYGGFVAVLSEVCEAYGIPYRGVPVATIKRRATGRGNAPKDAVTTAARLTFLPLLLASEHNRADALWTLQVGLDELQPVLVGETAP